MMKEPSNCCTSAIGPPSRTSRAGGAKLPAPPLSAPDPPIPISQSTTRAARVRTSIGSCPSPCPQVDLSARYRESPGLPKDKRVLGERLPRKYPVEKLKSRGAGIQNGTISRIVASACGYNSVPFSYSFIAPPPGVALRTRWGQDQGPFTKGGPSRPRLYLISVQL